MNAERHRRLQELFLRARELTRDEERVFLEEVRRDQPDLREELEALLEHDREPVDLVNAAWRGGAAVLVDELARFGAPDTVEQTQEDTEELPRRIGRYTVIRKIGLGGMAVVYEAEQEDPRRRVAVKVIRPGLESREVLARFEREVQVHGKLKHSGIAQIYEAGTAKGNESEQPFFAMELVDGQSLIEYADAESLDTDDRLRLIARTCDALHYAHRKGIVHRDLKPSNILVSTEGTDEAGQPVRQPKILDFGVAMATDANIETLTLQTDVDQLVGTLTYMSPEQTRGPTGELDFRSDVYSIGVVAFELLTGRLPYDVKGKSIYETLRVIRQDDPTNVGSLDRRLRGDIATIIARALEKERERRYASAAELAADIRRHLADEPIVARPASALYRVRKFTRRNRTLVAGVAVAFAALLTATVLSLWHLRAARISESEAAEQRTIADDRASALEEALWRASRLAVAGAVKAMETRDGAAARAFLGVVDGETWEFRHLMARLDQSIEMFELDEPVRAATFVDNGEQIITADAAGRVQRWHLHRPEAVVTVSLEAELTGPAAFSRDGLRIAGVIGPKQDAAALWDCRSGRRLADLTAAQMARIAERRLTRPLRALALSPDGLRVALGGHGGFMWEPGAGITARFGVDRFWALSFNADGSRWLGSFRRAKKTKCFFRAYDSLDGDSASRVRSRPSGRIRAVALTSDGQRGLLGAVGHRAELVDLSTGELVQLYVGHSGLIRAAAIGPDDQLLATGSSDRTVRLWDLETAATVAVFAGLGSAIDQLAFNRDGTRLLSVAARSVQVFPVRREEETTVLRGHDSAVVGVATMRDGARIVSASKDGDLRFWNAESGERVAVLEAGGPVLSLAASAADAHLIATAHERGVVRLWSAETGEHRRDVRPNAPSRITALAIARDGSRVAARSTAHVTIWNPRGGEQIVEFPLPGYPHYGAIAVSADGAQVAFDLGEFVVVRTAEGRGTAEHLSGHAQPVEALAFSPDGRFLASGARDNTVRLWRLGDGEQLFVLKGMRRNIFALAFSPDGSCLASAGGDRRIEVWDTRRGERMITLVGHGGDVLSLAWSPDGSRLVSGARDHTVRVWDTLTTRERWGARTRSAALRQRAAPLVESLYAALGEPDLVIEALKSRTDLDDAALDAALDVVLERSPRAGGSGR